MISPSTKPYQALSRISGKDVTEFIPGQPPPITNCFSSPVAWSPALRTGQGWQDYLTFDFLDVARINRIHIGTNEVVNSRRFRPATKVMLQISSTPNVFRDLMSVELPPDGNIEMDKPLLTRFVQVVILEVADGDEENEPIGVNE